MSTAYPPATADLEQTRPQSVPPPGHYASSSQFVIPQYAPHPNNYGYGYQPGGQANSPFMAMPGPLAMPKLVMPTLFS